MNLTRLVILGLLAEHGPRHGHQLRRDAELAEVDLAQRKQALHTRAAELATERAEGEAKGYLLPSVSPLQAASFRRAERHVAAELAWHEERDGLLGAAQRP